MKPIVCDLNVPMITMGTLYVGAVARRVVLQGASFSTFLCIRAASRQSSTAVDGGRHPEKANCSFKGGAEHFVPRR